MRLKNNIIIALFAYLLLCSFIPCGPVRIAEAHPIEFHMRPLDAAAVERVIGSLERMVTELERSGKVGDVSVDGSEGPIPLWQIQHAIANADGTSLVESPTLKDLLLASGYDDSPFVVEEWQLQADRVLDVYGSIESGSEVGDPAHDHEEDRVTIGRYRQQLSALALRLASS